MRKSNMAAPGKAVKACKRLLATVLVAAVILAPASGVSGAMSLSNFDKVREYHGEFGDISPRDWYYSGIVDVYERGILEGKGAGSFDPAGKLTIAETIALAAKLHKGYYTGSMEFPAGEPWYEPYVAYALDNDIPAGSYKNMAAAATRSDFALIITGGLPDEALTPINRIPNGAIPDVFESYSYGQAVYRLYRAGVITGLDSYGTFFPGRTLTRGEAATLISRVVYADSRVEFNLAVELTAEQIYSLASPAVFYIEVLDDDGSVVKTGSGFFINESGLAVTNYHVLVGATNARITTDNGEVFNIAGIYDYNRKKDTALIQVDGAGFNYLELADSAELQTGATVYTLGSPLRLQASFARGIVSQALREIEGSMFIQLDAPISSGSSGGALIDSYGRAVGVTCATMLEAQNINLAVPINFYRELNQDTLVPLRSILIQVKYYQNYYPAPDFGAFSGITVYNSAASRGGMSYSYRLSDFKDDPDDTIEGYINVLEQHQFVLTSYLMSGDDRFDVYYNSRYFIIVAIGMETIRGHECFTVTVS